MFQCNTAYSVLYNIFHNEDMINVWKQPHKHINKHDPDLKKLTGCGEDAHDQADLSVPQQGHVCMLGPRPVLIPFGLEGGPDADPEHQQVEYDGGHQSWHVESHVPGAAALTERTAQSCMQTAEDTGSTRGTACLWLLGGAASGWQN